MWLYFNVPLEGHIRQVWFYFFEFNVWTKKILWNFIFCVNWNLAEIVDKASQEGEGTSVDHQGTQAEADGMSGMMGDVEGKGRK
jgi:hypothetical protein